MFQTIESFKDINYSKYNAINISQLDDVISLDDNKIESLYADISTNKNNNLNSNNLNLMNVEDHDVVFLFGNLNFRVDNNFDETYNLLEMHNNNINHDLHKKIIKNLYSTYNQINNCNYNFLFKEPKIKFKPTYKYEVNSSKYSKNKKRTPSWTDRILFLDNRLYNSKYEKNNYVYNKIYNVIEDIIISDHKPVFSIYKVIVNKTNNLINDTTNLNFISNKCTTDYSNKDNSSNSNFCYLDDEIIFDYDIMIHYNIARENYNNV